MVPGSENRLPRWAPRVPRRLIQRFYEADAQGIYDDDLIEEVGCALLARCQSFVAANRASDGDLSCPWCDGPVPREETLRCACGWELPWAEYFRSIQHKQLSGAEPVLAQFRDYVTRYPLARTPRERVLLIDRLIHGFHWLYKTQKPTRPVAVNLIEGNLNEVVEFLDGLSSGAGTPGLEATRAEWDRNIDANAEWYRSRRSPSREQG